MQQYINDYMQVLNKYAVFDGRERRRTYWTFVLANMIILMVAMFVISIISATLAGLVAMVFWLGIICPTIAAGVRRMHDTGHEWWWLIIPLANLIFALTPGAAGPNQYGPDPKR